MRRRIVIVRPQRQGRRWMGEVCRPVIKLFGYGQGEAMGGGQLRNHVTIFGKGIARTVQYGQARGVSVADLSAMRQAGMESVLAEPNRSDERRDGKAWICTGRCQCAPYNKT